jgi:hypothetical protein
MTKGPVHEHSQQHTWPSERQRHRPKSRAKVGLSPEHAEQAIAALGQAHTRNGDTVQTASENSGIPTHKLSQIVQHIDGEGSLGQFASLLEGQGGASSLLGGLKSFL